MEICGPAGNRAGAYRGVVVGHPFARGICTSRLNNMKECIRRRLRHGLFASLFSQSLFEKSDAGGFAWQMDGCKDADSKHIPEYVEDKLPRRRPFAAPKALPAEFPNGL